MPTSNAKRGPARIINQAISRRGADETVPKKPARTRQVVTVIPNEPGYVPPLLREESGEKSTWSHADPVTPIQDFVALGTPLVNRGFWITPVHPETKRGVFL